MDDAASTARRMRALFEPVHVVTYLAPEARDAFEAAGLRGILARLPRRAVPAVWDLAAAGELMAVAAGLRPEGRLQPARGWTDAEWDAAAARPCGQPGTQRASALATMLLLIARACAAVMPFPNPVGVPAPAPVA